jgi:hypothetical protein
MYFITYHGQPEIATVETAGAYINCYIQKESFIEADRIARKEIKDLNWKILDQEDAFEINIETLSDDGRKYYEQALIDQAVYVFHNYSNEDMSVDDHKNDIAVFTTKYVLENKKTITYVSHDIEDGAWQFFSDDKFEDYSEVARIVGLKEIVDLDSTLNDLLEMEIGYIATRKDINDKWIIEKVE